MRTKASDRLLETLEDAGDQIGSAIQRRPAMSIGGFLLLVALVGLGIWAWPELKRTIHIHRM